MNGGSPYFVECVITYRLAGFPELVRIQHIQVCKMQLKLRAVAAQALYDHAHLAKNAPLGNQSLLALQFRGPGAAPTPMRTRAWLIEVRDWHRCFCVLSQARYEQQRNKDRASTAHAK